MSSLNKGFIAFAFIVLVLTGRLLISSIGLPLRVISTKGLIGDVIFFGTRYDPEITLILISILVLLNSFGRQSYSLKYFGFRT